MKKSSYRKIAAASLSLVLSLGLLAGCGSTATSAPAPETEVEEPEVQETATETTEPEETYETISLSLGAEDTASLVKDDQLSGDPADHKMASNAILNSKLSMASGDVVNHNNSMLSASSAGLIMEPLEGPDVNEITYVMIYNPYCYDQIDLYGNYESRALATGFLGDQINTNIERAGGLDDEDMLVPDKQIEYVDIGALNMDLNRAGGMDPIYSEGDTHEFYVDRVPVDFTCLYEGDYCYVWSAPGCISDDLAADLGKVFDEKVYHADIDTFGPARFTDNGGKVHLLYHEMEEEGVLGYFSIYDLYASSEVTPDQIEAFGLNTDHAIIHFNEAYADSSMGPSTTAHEFQHLINFSDTFLYESTPVMDTWLNEAMSAYAEELVFPGVKDSQGYNTCMFESENFRNGQSLYNFDTKYDNKIGAYGAVFLFSRYLEALGGDKVYFDIHEFWRTEDREDMNEAEAIISALDPDVVAQIDHAYKYPESIMNGFDSEEQVWMSKLTLDFYLETIAENIINVDKDRYGEYIHKLMLYADENSADIEGGGRILVEAQNGNYEIPDDADQGLVYIGLDADFNVVTPIICAQ